MAAGFSVKDALNKNSKAGIDESPRARFRTKDISIFKMYRNDMNFYSVEQVEELAGDILMYGLKQNLELVYAPCDKGEYRIVAGERRWEALKYLVSKGYKEFELATSKLTTPQDNDEEQVEIIIANAYRTKTTSDMIEEETRLKASLERMKVAGKKIKGYDLQSGRLRDVISSMLHVSKTKIAQIEAINNNLIPEWKEELKKERLTFSAAYELSGMTEDEQRETLGKFSETGELTHKEVKDIGSLTDNVPEGALQTNPDGSVNTYDADGNKVGTVDAETVEKMTTFESDEDAAGQQEDAEDGGTVSNDAETTNPPSEPETGENGANTEPQEAEDEPEDKVIIPQGKMKVTVICDGSLNIRRSAAWGNENICGRAIRGQSYYVKEIHVVDGKKMVRTIGDLYLSGESEHVQFEQL